MAVSSSLAQALSKALGRKISDISGGFYPSNIADQQVWLDADDLKTITESSLRVSAWDGKAGNGNDADQATGTNQPLYAATGIGGKPSIDFSPIDEGLAITANATITDVWSGGGSLYAVINANDDGSFAAGRIASKDKWELLTVQESNGYCKLQFTADFSTTTGLWVTTNYAIQITNDTVVEVYYDSDSAANDPVIIINGVTCDLTRSSTPSGTYVSDTSDDLYIGNIAALTRSFDGDIGEVLIYSRSLATGERSLVRNYLNNKWGINSQLILDVADLGLWLEDPANNATYDSDGLISSWTDLSGNGKITVQSTDANKFTMISNQLNGYSVARGGTSLLMTSDYQISSSGYTVFSAFRMNKDVSTDATFKRLFRSDSDSQALFIRRSNGDFEIKSLATGASDPRPTFDYGTEYAVGETSILTSVVQLDSLQTNADGVEQFDTARSATASSLTVGASTEIFGDTAGDLASLAVYDRVLLDEEISYIENYLSKFAWQGKLNLQEDAGLLSPAVTGGQGVTTDGTYFYNIGTNAIYKYDLSWNLITSNTDLIGDAGLASPINHAGDSVLVNGLIYVPIEEYPNSPYDTQYICVYDASDLSFVTKYDISAQGMEVSGIGHNPEDNLLYVCSFGSPGYIWKYTLEGVFVDVFQTSTQINLTQGICFWKGYMFLSSSAPSDHSIYQFETNGSYVGKVFNFASSTEGEGLNAYGDYLITLQAVSSTKKVHFLEIA